MSRNVLITAVLTSALLVSACSSGTGSTGDQYATSNPQQPGTGAETTSTVKSTSDTVAPTGGTTEDIGEITFDGVTYGFGMNGPVPRCEIASDGSFNAILFVPDLTAALNVKLYDDENRISYVRADVVIDGTMSFMNADPTSSTEAVEMGSGFVETFTYDDKHAEGTGMFVNLDTALGADQYPLEAVVGNFAVTCP